MAPQVSAMNTSARIWLKPGMRSSRSRAGRKAPSGPRSAPTGPGCPGCARRRGQGTAGSGWAEMDAAVWCAELTPIVAELTGQGHANVVAVGIEASPNPAHRPVERRLSQVAVDRGCRRGGDVDGQQGRGGQATGVGQLGVRARPAATPTEGARAEEITTRPSRRCRPARCAQVVGDGVQAARPVLPGLRGE